MSAPIKTVEQIDAELAGLYAITAEDRRLSRDSSATYAKIRALLAEKLALAKGGQATPAPEINHDGQRVILVNEAGDLQNRTTLGEFLADNPDLVVDSADIMQMVEQVGFWTWDGGAGGVFKIVPVDFHFYGLTLDEWDALRAPVRARLIELSRICDDMYSALDGMLKPMEGMDAADFIPETAYRITRARNARDAAKALPVIAKEAP